jgi:hypothetical protein
MAVTHGVQLEFRRAFCNKFGMVAGAVGNCLMAASMLSSSSACKTPLRSETKPGHFGASFRRLDCD